MKTTIDWVTFRTYSDPFKILEKMVPAFGTCGDLLELVAGEKGRDGWTYSKEILLAGDIRLGSIDYGGESQRGWVRVNLSGTGCEWVQDWAEFQRLGIWLDEYELRRVDIALTTYNGEITDKMVCEAHEAGEFVSKVGGRPPELRSIVSSNPRAGKTRYIGSRAKTNKMLRCYEKGFEMIKDVPESIRNSTTHVEGSKVEEIYRVELELKAVDTVIRFDVFTLRDQVFAGAYPWCAKLLEGVGHVRMQRLPDFKPRAKLSSVLKHCKSAYGAAIFTAMQVYGGDAEKVLSLIMGDHHSRALVEAGALTVDYAE